MFFLNFNVKNLTLLLLLLLSSCAKKQQKILIYFYKGDISSHIPLTCNDFDKKVGGNYITVYSDSLSQNITKSLNSNLSQLDDVDIDVKYKIVLKGDTICIDDFGIFILNDELKGKLKCFDDIKKVIKENSKNSIYINTVD